MPWTSHLREVLKTEVQLLLLRPVKPDLRGLGRYYLGFGLICAWIAGIGRYWDNPKAELWQSLGLGSLAYVFVLAAILWLMVWPLRPNNWSYSGVLTFVGLTSPPALLYAIPVERVFTLGTAQVINMWFLLIVAAWRVTLLFLYLKRAAGLSAPAAFVGTFLPLVVVVNALASLNLEHVVFRVMAGLEEDEKSANDAAYLVLLAITWVSLIAAPILLAVYGLLFRQGFRRKPGTGKPADSKDAA